VSRTVLDDVAAGPSVAVDVDGLGVERMAVGSSGWVSVRCVFRTEHAGDQIYEERVTLWWASDMDSAIELAEAEARGYAAGFSGPPGWSTEYIGLAQAYLLSDQPGHGAEVFSLMRRSTLDPDAYLDTYFDTGAELEQAID
jgi:hypothetical protein